MAVTRNMYWSCLPRHATATSLARSPHAGASSPATLAVSASVPNMSNASSTVALPSGPAVRPARGRRQSLQVLTAGAAGQQVGRDTGEPPLRRTRNVAGDLVAENQLDVDLQHFHGLLAAHIAGIGPQELFQCLPARHDRRPSSLSRYPLATRLARSLRRASNIVL